MPASGPRAGGEVEAMRIALLASVASFLLFLPLQHAHFKGSDELALYEMTRSLHERGELSIPPLRHSVEGADGRRYSFFAPGQAVLALPLYALATPLEALLPAAWSEALAGPPLVRGPYRFGGELAGALVRLYGPLSAALLVGLFCWGQLAWGVPARRAAALSLLVAVGTHTAVQSAYFLRHTSEALLLLAAFLLFARWLREGSLRALALGSALASLVLLVRVPAAIAAPVLAGLLGYGLHARGLLQARGAALWTALAAVVAPLLVALALHGALNDLRWGGVLASPMVDQQDRMREPWLRGLAGLLASPGSSVFVYSPLLVLAPFGLAHLWRERRAECVALLALFVSSVLFYARFDGWSGLWSSPGPRYLFFLVPLLLLPLGRWLEGPLRWAATLGLAAVGLWVQLVSTFVRWGQVQALAGWPAEAPDQAGFLFRLGESPPVVMSRLFLGGGPYDAWWLDLARGWPGVPGRPGAVAVLALLWLLLVAASLAALWRAARPHRIVA